MSGTSSDTKHAALNPPVDAVEERYVLFCFGGFVISNAEFEVVDGKRNGVDSIKVYVSVSK